MKTATRRSLRGATGKNLALVGLYRVALGMGLACGVTTESPALGAAGEKDGKWHGMPRHYIPFAGYDRITWPDIEPVGWPFS
jgi:hypothetical protein